MTNLYLEQSKSGLQETSWKINYFIAKYIFYMMYLFAVSQNYKLSYLFVQKKEQNKRRKEDNLARRSRDKKV